MRNVKSFFILLVTTLFVFSCEEIPVSLADPIIPESDKVVLIEELTGVSCTNCPKGHSALEAIQVTFPKQVAIIGIHGNLLTEPIKNLSKYDFRNQLTRDLEKSFQAIGKPAAAINRRPNAFNELSIPNPDLWDGAVRRELGRPHQLNILLDVKYDEASRRVSVEVAAIPLEDLDGNYNISVYLTESNIVDAQANGSENIKDYVHKHVLRDMMTKFDGDILGSNLKKFENIKRTYSYTLPTTPAGLWIPENMELVVMVSHASPTDKSVVQAAYTYVKK